MIEDMSVKIPPEIRAAMTEIARKTGALGGKTAAKNMTPAERTVRAMKAAKASALKRTEKRLARERQAKPAKSAAKHQ